VSEEEAEHDHPWQLDMGRRGHCPLNLWFHLGLLVETLSTRRDLGVRERCGSPTRCTTVRDHSIGSDIGFQGIEDTIAYVSNVSNVIPHH
jgi:hypothetical protein